MEGNERNFETDAGQEEGQTEQCHRKRATTAEAHEMEIEGSTRAVEERNAIEHERCRKQGEENELRAGFGTLIAHFVISHQRGHRHRGEFETDEEHEEMTCGDHEIHAQQGEERNDVEFALLHKILLARHPTMRHEEGDERADTQHGFDHNGHAIRHIHATESCLSGVTADEHPNIDCDGQEQHHKRKRSIVDSLALVVGAHEKIGHKEDQHCCEQ